jgi:ABC-2 type transport system ATP-binding protein
MIQLEAVTKLYGTVIGVNDVSLKLEPGSYGLLGPNGSGKTTLINLLMGQLRPTIGSVSVFGANPARNDRVLQRIGLCPASDLLIPNISAMEWVSYQVELYGFSRAEALEKATEALKIVGMNHAKNRNIGTYSLGMRQRTKLAQAIAHDPDLLILDEPFNGLDPIGRHEMTQLLMHWRQSGRSILLASHVLHEIEAIRPSFLLISGGRLLASGSPTEVRNLLVDLPNEIELEVDQPQRVAALICEHMEVDTIRVTAPNEMMVVTRHSQQLFEYLPILANEHGVQIHQVRTRDESLQDLFTTLMRRHRGEL